MAIQTQELLVRDVHLLQELPMQFGHLLHSAKARIEPRFCARDGAKLRRWLMADTTRLRAFSFDDGNRGGAKIVVGKVEHGRQLRRTWHGLE